MPYAGMFVRPYYSHSLWPEAGGACMHATICVRKMRLFEFVKTQFMLCVCAARAPRVAALLAWHPEMLGHCAVLLGLLPIMLVAPKASLDSAGTRTIGQAPRQTDCADAGLGSCWNRTVLATPLL
jgi:hypothetical protein